MGKSAAVTMFWWLGSGIHGAWIGRTLSKHCDRGRFPLYSVFSAFFLNAMKDIYNKYASPSIHLKKIFIVLIIPSRDWGMNFKYILVHVRDTHYVQMG